MNKTSLLLAFLLYLAALALRLQTITVPGPQADEVTWRNRSQKVVEAIKEGEYYKATSHLGHPGTSPALIMATGQVLGHKANAAFGLNPGDKRYLDDLSASRIANAVFSSLIVPAAFCGAYAVFGAPPALFAGVLAATDVHLIAYARLAHLDAALSVFVFCSVILFGLAVTRKSVPLKLAAGFFWGLAMSAKASAVALIPAFFLFKAAYRLLFSGKDPQREATVLGWGELWAVLVGHFALVAVSTRFWLHDSFYRTGLHIVSKPADVAYRTGLLLQAYPAVTLLAVLTLACGAAYFYRRSPRGALNHHLCCALATAASLVLLLALFPAVFENVFRFWTRTIGWASLKHEAYGHVTTPPKFGYLGMFASRPSTLLIIAVILGSYAAFRAWRKEVGAGEKPAIVLLLLLVIIVWPLVLQSSPKQAWRYIISILGPGMLIAGFGIAFVTRSAGLTKSTVIAAALCLAFQGALLYRHYPDYLFFHNAIGGGIHQAAERGERFLMGGTNEALALLQQRAQSAGRTLRVALHADQNAITAGYNRLYPTDRRRLVLSYMPLSNADYVLRCRGAAELIDASCCENRPELREVFRYSADGLPLTTVYEVLAQNYATAYRRPLLSSPRHTGRVSLATDLLTAPPRGLRKLVRLNPQTDKQGFAFFGESVRPLPGDYSVGLLAGLAKHDDSSSLPADAPALRVEWGADCTQEITLRDLPKDALLPLLTTCHVTGERRFEVRAYWYGTVPMLIRELQIQSKQDAANPINAER